MFFQLLQFSLLLFYSSAVANVYTSNVNITAVREDCPVWHILSPNTNSCVCGDDLHYTVLCSDQEEVLYIKHCYSISYNNDSKSFAVGNVPYTCNYLREFSITEDYLTYSDFNKSVCSEVHRKGQLCGKCEDGYATPAISYHLECVPCSDYDSYKYNWLKYIAAAYLPVTVLFLIVVLFRVRFTSADMNCLLLVLQLIASPSTLLFSVTRHNYVSIDALILFSDVFNLNFLSSLYDPFCLNPDFSFLQIASLDYIVGVYPLILIIFLIVLVEVHSSFQWAVRLWRPFQRFFAFFRRHWDIKASLVDAFATFILLTYTKLLNVSFILLAPSTLYTADRTVVNKTYLFYNGTMEYFGEEHLPYGVLAVTMLLVFNILPVFLLCLYPTPCCQKSLNCCRIRWHGLRVFMDSFQGFYRTEPHDCRYFSVVYLVFRIVNTAVFSMTLSRVYLQVVPYPILLLIMIVLAVRPYKNRAFNTLDVILLLGVLAMCLNQTSVFIHGITTGLRKTHFLYIIYCILLAPLVLYAVAAVSYKFIPKCAAERVRLCVQRRMRRGRGFTDSWPSRLNEERGEHTPLLQ